MASVSQATFQKDSILDLLYNIVIITFKLEDDWEYMISLISVLSSIKKNFDIRYKLI